MTTEERVEQQQRQLDWLTTQVSYLFQLNQLQFRPVGQAPAPSDGRTETGMGAIVSPDKTSFI